MTRILLLAALTIGIIRHPTPAAERTLPNILIAIADDQSWQDTGAAGCVGLRTPAFDRVARSGALFLNCFAGSPGCSPSRAALLTGRHHWQLRQAGTHASSFPSEYVTFPDLLEKAGYNTGFTGKGWGPGNWKTSGRTRNPAGPEFSARTLNPPQTGLSKNDYAANFDDFLAARDRSKPFLFWFGAHEPHRAYQAGSGRRLGKTLADAVVPPFLPDTQEVRSDLLDYYTEIEWFDQHLNRMLNRLDEAGELNNTLVIVTGDNGMPFPRAKANLYEFGIHVPLAVSWPNRMPGNRSVEDLVGFVDLTATILDAARVTHPALGNPSLAPAGQSILPILMATDSGRVDRDRTMVFSGRERHSSSRWNNLGYPGRAVRTHDFLYIRNFHPERWPAGAPQKLNTDSSPGPMHGGYHDIDACPTLTHLIDQQETSAVRPFFQWAVSKRPGEELFRIREDPGCLRNLAADPEFQEVRNRLRDSLDNTLKSTGDPRAGDNPEIWESYPRYSAIRTFPPESE